MKQKVSDLLALFKDGDQFRLANPMEIKGGLKFVMLDLELDNLDQYKDGSITASGINIVIDDKKPLCGESISYRYLEAPVDVPAGKREKDYDYTIPVRLEHIDSFFLSERDPQLFAKAPVLRICVLKKEKK